LVFALVATCGVAARIGFGIYAARHVDQSLLDVQTYTRIAQNILDGHGFSLVPPHPTVFVAPLYPAALALVRYVTGSFSSMIAIQAILWVAVALLVQSIGEKWLDRRSARLASLFVLLHPELIAISAFLYSETLFVTFLYAALAALAIAATAAKPKALLCTLAASALLGLATLTRPVTLYFVPLAAALPFFWREHLGWKGATQVAVLALLGFAVVVAPWSLRNRARTGSLVPVATGGGTALWIGNYQPFDGEYRYQQTRELMDRLTSGLSEVEADRLLTKMAIQGMRQRPVEAMKLLAKKLWRYWLRSYEKLPDGRPRHWTVTGIGLQLLHLVLLSLAALGLWLSRRRWRIMLPFLLLVLYMTAIHSLSLPVPRYRLPLLPGLLLFAAAGLLSIYDRAKARRWESA